MSLTRLRALALTYADQLRLEAAALDALRTRLHAGEITLDELDRELVELVLARVYNLPKPIVDELREELLDVIATDLYFVASREAFHACARGDVPEDTHEP